MEKRKLMCDYIHKCLKCDSVSYEVKEGFYICGHCGFKWEVQVLT